MTEPIQTTGSATPADDEEISLLDLAIVLAKHKKLILGLPIVAAVVAAVISLLMPLTFTATSKILPPQQTQSTASTLLNQLGGLGSLAGGAAGIKNPNDIYVAMLKSRTVADALIKRFELDKDYNKKLMSDTRKALEKKSKFDSGKDGIITISFAHKNPKRAAEIANAYVDELYKLTKMLAVTVASQKRLFFEEQLKDVQTKLDQAEMAARSALNAGGIAKAEIQGMAMIGANAQLRAQITAKEVQIGAMRSFAGDRNPDMVRAQNEIASLRNELAKLEGQGSISSAGQQAKDNGAENLELLRNAKYYENLVALLNQQYEMAKIDESKDAAIIQVMDKAIEPDKKSGPKRTLIVLITALVTGLLAVLVAFVLEAMEKAKANPDTANRMAQLRRMLAWR